MQLPSTLILLLCVCSNDCKENDQIFAKRMAENADGGRWMWEGPAGEGGGGGNH